MNQRIVLFNILCLLLSGCAVNVQQSANYPMVMKQVKVVAVMPPDMELNQITAGGQVELIDEWSLEAKEIVTKALKDKLSASFDYELKFIDENWLKENHGLLWKEYKSLYNVVSRNAVIHTMYPAEKFPSKKENFDYTLGSDVHQLAESIGADLLLFTYGEEHYQTKGRIAAGVFTTVGVAVLSGGAVVIIPQSVPDVFIVSLVNGKTGQVEWIRTLPAALNKSFKKEDEVQLLVEKMVKDMTVTEKSTSKK